MRVLTHSQEKLPDGGLGPLLVELWDLSRRQTDRVGHRSSVVHGASPRLPRLG